MNQAERTPSSGMAQAKRGFNVNTLLRQLMPVAAAISVACVATAQAQMSAPGQFSVSAGAATYNVPIQLPPGIAGLQPALTLGYSSKAGNGLVGVGWSLSGLSAISRCPRTVPQDGVRGTVNFDLNDRYCLDGQRLIVISGSDGANGSEYRTERESFAKVVAYSESGAANGPGSFIVKTAAGLTMEYGKTADSRIEAQGKSVVAIWALNKVYDTKGNYYTVSYAEDEANGDWRPASIAYTGNANTGQSPQLVVQFAYESRPDVLTSYLSGSRTSTQLRLSGISLTGGNFYRITYGSTEITSHSRVSKIEWCADTGACMPAVVPGYSPGESFSTPLGVFDPIAVTDLNGNTGAIITGDWNGDGRSDILWFDQPTGNNRWYVSTGSLGFTSYLNPVPASALNGGVVHPGDWNGDGVTDFLWYDRQTGHNRWFINNGALSFTEYDNVIAPDNIDENIGDLHLGDWNGDGRLDVMWYDAASGLNRWFVSSGLAGGAPAVTTYLNPIATANINGGGAIHIGDWDGDGNSDLMRFDAASGDNRWFLNSGSLTFTQVVNPIAATDLNGGKIQFGDWNSDGMTDIVWYSNIGGNRWYVNNGSLAFIRYADPIPPADINGDSLSFYVGDWNGDGRVDVLAYDGEGGNNRWFINKGDMQFSKIVNPIPASSVNSSSGQMYFGDWNGNGIIDMLFYSGSSGTNRWYLNQGAAGQEMTWVDQGVGGASRVNITYGALTEMLGTQYFKEVVPVYPKLSVAVPMRVVKEVSVPNGIGGQSTVRYSYGNLLTEVGNGRGLLGFQWVQSKDMSSGVVSRTYYRQDWPYLGLVEKSGRGTSEANWSNLGLSTTTYACTAIDSEGTSTACSESGAVAPRSRYVTYPAQVDDLAWDYTGTTATDGIFIALPRSRTTQTQDAFGNVTTMKVETLNPDGSASGFSKTTTNVYAPADTTNWFLGRLVRSSVTATSP